MNWLEWYESEETQDFLKLLNTTLQSAKDKEEASFEDYLIQKGYIRGLATVLSAVNSAKEKESA